MKKILFVCTGNSCRSQMAEAWMRKLHPHQYEVFSAGMQAQGVNPLAVRVMSEVGVDMSSQISKTLDQLPDVKMDYVITVCSEAHERCPYVPGGKIIHVGFDDPPRLTAHMRTDEDKLPVYRRVRDEIKTFVQNIDLYLK